MEAKENTKLSSQELRVGNKVLNDGIVVTVDGRTIFDIWSGNGGNYSPIDLTEEWLKEFGFKKKPHLIIGKLWEINTYESNNKFKKLSVSLDPGNQYMFYRQGDRNTSMGVDDIVNLWNVDLQGKIYVHSLQNLYYSLTAIELTK